MKKTFYLIMIVFMLFAFVACNPESNTEDLLPGEVTPPAESKRVEASDEDIEKSITIVAEGVDGSVDSTEKTISLKSEFTFDNDDTLSLSAEYDNNTTTISADGKLTINEDVYTISNYVVTKTNDKYTEEGTILKNDKEMSDSEAYQFLFDIKNGKDELEVKSLKVETVINFKFTFKNDDGTTGKGETLMVELADNDDMTAIFDVTYGEDRVQCKITGKVDDYTNYSVEYVALNGKFFNAASCEKFLKMMTSQN